jgi:phage-related tail protein
MIDQQKVDELAKEYRQAHEDAAMLNVDISVAKFHLSSREAALVLKGAQEGKNNPERKALADEYIATDEEMSALRDTIERLERQKATADAAKAALYQRLTLYRALIDRETE